MKKIFLFIFIAIIVANAYSQLSTKDFDVKWGPEIKMSKKSNFNDVVGYDESGFYAIRNNSKGFRGYPSLEKYDRSMNLKKTFLYDYIDKKRQRSHEFILQIKDKLYLFETQYNDDALTKTLFAREINKTTLQPTGKEIEMAKLTFESRRDAASFGFQHKISNDEKKILIYYNSFLKKNDNERFFFHVYDQSLKLQWSKDVELPYAEKLFDVEDYQIDDDGNVHLLGLLYKEKRKEKRKGEPNYSYEIISYLDQGTKVKKYPVKLEGFFFDGYENKSK